MKHLDGIYRKPRQPVTMVIAQEFISSVTKGEPLTIDGHGGVCACPLCTHQVWLRHG